MHERWCRGQTSKVNSPQLVRKQSAVESTRLERRWGRENEFDNNIDGESDDDAVDSVRPKNRNGLPAKLNDEHFPLILEQRDLHPRLKSPRIVATMISHMRTFCDSPVSNFT